MAIHRVIRHDDTPREIGYLTAADRGGGVDIALNAVAVAHVQGAPLAELSFAHHGHRHPITAYTQRSARLAELVTLTACGNEDAFAELYDLTAARIYGVVLHVLRSTDHTVEVTQEVFLEVWKQAARYSPEEGAVLAWMTTIARRRAVDRVRSVSSEAARDERYAAATVDRPVDYVWAGVEQRLDADRVQRGLECLTASQREAITLAYFGGYSQRQVAQLLSLPLGTVKTRIRNGLARLRDVLGQDCHLSAQRV
jgi:RNA polymerase sigma-70 factor, ECF subfamily